MLPEILAGSYKRYKEDTNVFATWLSTTAKACGYKSENSPQPPVQKDAPKIPSSRLKGKARKEAQKAAANGDGPSQDVKLADLQVTRYTVKTKDFLDQAKVVTKSVRPRIQMPLNILRVVQRAIHARKRCADWFRKTGAKDEASIEGHDHFINVLENALAILLPCCPKSAQTSKQEQKPKTSALEPESSHNLSNRFGMLNVEDTNDIVLDLAASDISATSATKKSSKATTPHSSDVYELEIQHGTDLAFLIFCFFEDLHRIQDFIKETWGKQKAGTVDLETAAVTTNIALDIVRRAEEDIIATAPAMLAKPRSFQAIAMVIFHADALAKGDDVDKRLSSSDTLKITEFDEFIYLSTARILMKYEQISSFKIEQYPLPVPPVRMSYISRPELLVLPEVKRWEEEDVRLTQMLMDMSSHDVFQKVFKDRKEPVQDELSTGLHKLRNGEVSVWIVFAARVCLDIQAILGEKVGKPYETLKTAANAASAVLDMRVEGDELVPGGSGERWLAKDADHMMNLHAMLTFWIINNPFPYLKEKILEDHDPDEWVKVPEEMKGVMQEVEEMNNRNVLPQHRETAKKLNIRPIEPNPELTYIFTRNPVYCGTLAFNVAVDMEEAGVALANHHLTIFTMSHLYNALQQTGLLKGRWPEMDSIIKLHIKALFAGDLPTNPKECHCRFSLQLGLSARKYEQQASYRLIRASTKKKRPMLSVTPTSAIFRRFFDRKEPLKDVIFWLESLMQESRKSNKKGTRRTLTPLEFLTQLSDWLPETIPDIHIDYVSMTRTCGMLLKTLRSECLSQLDIEYKETNHEDTNEPVYLVMLLQILAETSEFQYFKEEIMRAGAGEDPELPEGPQLELAGEIVQKLLDERGLLKKVEALVTGPERPPLVVADPPPTSLSTVVA